MRRRLNGLPGSAPNGKENRRGGAGRSARSLRGSSLVEMLVTMLVAGILFLSMMDGLTLFSRAAARRAEALARNRRQAEGLVRMADVAAAADSIVPISGGLECYGAGRRTELLLCDSILLYSSDRFGDTLLRGVASLRLSACAPQPDTVEVCVEGFVVRLPAGRSSKLCYGEAIGEIEKGYGYEE